MRRAAPQGRVENVPLNPAIFMRALRLCVRTLVYRSRHRLSRDEEYRAVFGHRCRKSRGPATVFVRPNGRAEHRLGLSIGKRVGAAHERGRVKRMIREAFRLERASIPTDPAGGAYDLVVTARRHDPATLERWRVWFRDAAMDAIRVERKRGAPGDRA